MAIRFTDVSAIRGKLAATLDGLSSSLVGTFIAPASRTGVLNLQLGGVSANLTGIFTPSPARTGTLGSTFGGLTASFRGSFSNATSGVPAYSQDQPKAALWGLAGTRTFTDPSQLAFLAQFNWLTLGIAGWEAWANSGRDANTSVATILSGSTAPGGTQLFPYSNLNEIEEDANDAFPTWTAEVAARNWRLYNSGSSGALTPTNDPSTSATALVNYTDAVPVNPTSEHPYEFGAAYSYYKFLTKTKSDSRFTSLAAGLASASFSGIAQDNFLCNPQVNGDWSRDGTADVAGYPSTATPAMQAGQKRYVARIRQYAPTKYVIVNGGDYGRVTDAGAMALAADGIHCESYIGKSFSWETQSGWLTMMGYYYRALATAINPQLCVLGGAWPDTDSSGNALPRLPTANGYPPLNTQEQWARYIGGSAFMGEGSAAINKVSTGYSTDLANLYWPWFMGGVNGLARGWLGPPKDAWRPTAPKLTKGTIGIFGVEYTSGIVLVNPAGNGTQSIAAADIPGNWQYPAGSPQGTGVFVSYSLVERDALFLQRGAATGQLPLSHSVLSPMALAMYAPRTGSLDISFKNAYPGLLYRKPVDVVGGRFPYIYSLSAGAPAGMTVGQHFGDTDYGVINWVAPTTAGSFSYTVNCTDQAGTVVSTTVAVSVNTTAFLIFDAVNGHLSAANGGGASAGTGTLANPFKDHSDWYNGATGPSGTLSARKNDATYKGKICYYKNGSYGTSLCGHEEENTGNLPDGESFRVPVVNNVKPKTHLAFPGHSPVWDVTAACLHLYGDNTNGWWVHGITSAGVGVPSDYKFLAMDANPSDTMLFEMNFAPHPGLTSNNPTPFMILANSPASTYVCIVRCTYQGLSNAEAIELYDTKFTTFHENVVNNSSEGNGGGAYYKQGCSDISVRGTTGTGNSTCLFRYDNMDSVITKGTFAEILYNNYPTTGPAVLFGLNGGVNFGIVALIRNTWRAQFCQIISGGGAIMTGTINVTGDVNINDGTQAHGWSVADWSGTLTFDATFISGTASAGIVDANGNLLGASRTASLGISGHEIN